jgi:small-conductance mechanosensitive channel|tara:strand:+ start:664 stop:1734 length:1071 start_codon:yes stop_codon:yes gene_type:complete
MQFDIVVLETKLIEYLPSIIISILILSTGIIAAHTIKKAIHKVGTKVASKTKSNIDDVVFDYLGTGVSYIIFGVTLILAGNQFGLNSMGLVTGILILFLSRPLTKIVKILLDKIENQMLKKSKDDNQRVMFPLINKTIIVTIYIFTIILALGQVGIEVLPLVAGMGIAGLAIGLAAKNTLSNMIAGIFIIIDKPFKLGDRIEIWNAPKNTATWGDVVDIGLRNTRIKTTDNIIMVIPNSEIAKRDIVNYSTMPNGIRVRIPLGIAYEADLKEASNILLGIAKKTNGVSEKPVPRVVVKKFGESSVDLELRVWIKDAKIRRRITSGIGTKIKKEFDANDIDIPYPTRSIIVQGEKLS